MAIATWSIRTTRSRRWRWRLRVLPDVILLDLKMPRLSGFQILGQPAPNPVFAKTFIVILSASTDEAEKARAIELGAQGFLHKPIVRDELLAGLRNIVTAQNRDAKVRLV